MATNKDQHHFDLSNFVNSDKNFFQFTIDSLPVPIFFKDIDGIYLGCNSAFESFIKISKEELINHSAHELFDKQLADTYQRADQELFDNPGIQSYEHQIRTQTGEKVFVKFHKTCFYDQKGNVAGLIGVIFDITEQKTLEEKLINSATFDALTGFYNRRQGTDIAIKKITQASNGEIQLGIIMMDIDHFKQVNDKFGHTIGDEALRHFATIISQIKNDNESVIRWGGEEFLLLISAPIQQANFKEMIIQRANAFRERVYLTPMINSTDPLTLTISCGVSCYEKQTLRELINEADVLLYLAKGTGRNRVCG
jgi:diguanylate cyclase (GGDEF)-like protein/PAS domain S-box-containing protein